MPLPQRQNVHGTDKEEPRCHSLNSTPNTCARRLCRMPTWPAKTKDRFLQRHLRPVGKPGADPRIHPAELAVRPEPGDEPHFMERLGVNAVFNSGAIKLNGKYYLVARIEGNDRKSFLWRGRKRQPGGGLPLLGKAHPAAGHLPGGDQRLRYAPDPARGRLDLRRVLLREQGQQCE